MKKNYHPLDEIDLIAQIADLKEINYQNTLVITALVELLVEKGMMSRSDIMEKASALEVDLTIHLLNQNPSSPKDLH